MNKVVGLLAVLSLLGLGVATQGAITIATVTVGNPGNVADTRVMSDYSRGYGSVSYTYNIGKYEVTAGQYSTFLNAVAKSDSYGLYSTNMVDTASGCRITRSGVSGSYSYSVASDFANRPVNYVSYWDACRFANWLCNGQKTGVQDSSTTERGAYTLDGYTGNGGKTIQRNAGSTWTVTSEDEWYKAAYYKGGGINAGYWQYSTKSDTTPGNNLADYYGNNANYWQPRVGPYPIDSGKYTTVVGQFWSSPSAYHTFDQGGNVCEWTESLSLINGMTLGRVLRGGSFDDLASDLQASYRGYCCWPDTENGLIGFRVSQAIVPEPSAVVALLTGLAGLRIMSRKRLFRCIGS